MAKFISVTIPFQVLVFCIIHLSIVNKYLTKIRRRDIFWLTVSDDTVILVRKACDSWLQIVSWQEAENELRSDIFFLKE